MHPTVVVMLLALFMCGIRCLDAAAADASPVAPTIPDAHQYFESLVSGNGVTALYETRSTTGEFLGYESFPVLGYKGAKCNSGVTLKNDVKVDIDWSVVEKSKASDGTLNIFNGQEVQFRFFHMLSIEGGVVVQPSNPIPRLIFGITDELSRNRLLKAVELVSTACRSKSKFD
jgi:hypothetical protein